MSKSTKEKQFCNVKKKNHTFNSRSQPCKLKQGGEMTEVLRIVSAVRIFYNANECFWREQSFSFHVGNEKEESI